MGILWMSLPIRLYIRQNISKTTGWNLTKFATVQRVLWDHILEVP